MNREELAARRERYFDLVASGMNFTAAARAVGVSKRTGKVWRNGRTRATGRNEAPSVDWYRGDMPQPAPLHARYLSEAERIQIADLLHAGYSIRKIAVTLGRAPSTISRELRRNTELLAATYRPYRADQLAKARQRRPKQPKILANPALFRAVKNKLAKHWSPEQISAWLTRTFPDNKAMHACHETIYQAIYVQAKGSLKLEVTRALRTGRVRRKPRPHHPERRPRFREPMVMISDRPASVEDRAIPGHWEGDLILGAGNQSAIGTLVERATRFTILLHLPGHHDAGAVQEAIIKKMRHLPALLRNTLTWDQGSEMALHKKIATALNMDVYFCDPHSPWQRGTNENTNGLLRQYFPKGTDLSTYSEAYLDAVAEELNDRPRKTLNWNKPSEKILELINT
ncbi:IS30 family transposase [Actinobaculum suis]|nr:transposase [Actinobaculum suis]OCA94663.1 transposase [Actinobaculum suis]